MKELLSDLDPPGTPWLLARLAKELRCDEGIRERSKTLLDTNTVRHRVKTKIIRRDPHGGRGRGRGPSRWPSGQARRRLEAEEGQENQMNYDNTLHGCASLCQH